MTWTTEVTADTPNIWYRLNSISGGQFTDSSGNAHIGDIVDLGAGNPSTVSGFTHDGDHAQHFSSTNHYSRSEDVFTANYSNIAIECVVDRTTLGNSGTLLGFNDDFGILLTGSNQIQGAMFDTGFTPHTTANVTLSSGIHHLVLDFSGGTSLKLYVDGVVVGSAAMSSTQVGISDAFKIGQNSSGTVNVSVDEAIWYTHSLSAARVTAHYNIITPPAPVVSSVSPSSGATFGGTAVTLTGTYFTGATAVKFGVTSATFVFVNDTTITCTAPAHSAGAINVTVTTPNGTSSTGAGNQYTYSNVVTAGRWVFTDATNGSSYSFNVNPNSVTVPTHTKSILYQNRLGPSNAVLVMEKHDDPQVLQWSGHIVTQAQYDAFVTWFDKQYSFQVTDDNGITYDIYLTDFEPKRVRSATNQWLMTYTMKATLFG